MKLSELATPLRTVAAGSTLQEAARAMDRHHVGTLVVVDDEEPVGMISDRDLALHGLLECDPATAEVRSCMSAPLVRCSEEASAGEAARTMKEEGIRRVAVEDASGELIGVVSADDLLQVVGKRISFLTSTIHQELSAEAGGPPSGSHTYGSE